MKQCQTCGRPVPDSAAICDSCNDWAAGLEEFSPDSRAPKAAPEPTIPATGTSIGRREMLLAAAVVVGAAVLTFGFLFARGAPSSTVSAASGTGSARPASGKTGGGSSSAVARTWNTENQAHWLGPNRRGAAFEVSADDVVQTWLGPTRPSLIVRCTSRVVDAFVHTGSPLMIEANAEGKTVRVSLDDEPMSTERWQDAEDRTALFAPDGGAFLQRLRDAHTLQFGYTPHNASPVVARFHVSGLAPLMDRFTKDCGRTK
jgi:hypothetical protein